MAQGSILFVHGTGVRLPSYRSGFEHAVTCAAAEDITIPFVECAWGDPLGVEFAGASLPDPPSADQLAEEEAEFARWQWLFDDPLFELDTLTIRDSAADPSVPLPGRKPQWLKAWEAIAAYTPSIELQLLLKRGGLAACWTDAWRQIVEAPVAKTAFERSARELVEASHALARAVVAQLHVVAAARGVPGPGRSLRTSLVQRLIHDWKQEAYAAGTFLLNLFKRAATRVLRDHRNRFSETAALPIGDILLYQARGKEVRAYIRRKIAAAPQPVTIVAHSLGGIACFDLLAAPDPPTVRALVTAGSQSPLLYEIGALSSLNAPQPLPDGFPPWLNLYDRNDFLGYVAHRLFPAAKDVEVKSGEAFPDSHSAYFGNPDVWRAVRDFLA
jgi:hypothetical protein